MTTLAVPGRLQLGVARRWIAPATFVVLGLVDILVFGRYAHHGDATFAFSQPFAKVTVPNLTLPAAATCYVLGAASIALGALRVVDVGKVVRRADHRPGAGVLRDRAAVLGLRGLRRTRSTSSTSSRARCRTRSR